MKNKELWKPNLFILDENKNLQANPTTLGRGSDLTRTYHLSRLNNILKKYIKGKLLDLGCGFVPFYEFYKDLITDSVCNAIRAPLKFFYFLTYTLNNCILLLYN